MSFNPQLPFLATLELPDVSKLKNDPILHDPQWPPVPTKIPSDCPKFDGKAGEDPQAHVMMYHLWSSSNSWLDDSIRLRLFQRTLTGSAAKWYIELSRASFHDFNSLAMAFLNHFQLPIRYETGTHLLTSLKQSTATHISDHIHEWRRRCRLIKFWIPDFLLTDWFTTSFVRQIARDIAMGACVTEEQAIARAQYLDLVYSQSGTLYDYLPDAPRLGTSKAPPKPSVDGVIGSVAQALKKSSNSGKQKSSSPNENSSQGILISGNTSEVNAVQSSTTGKASKGKKKEKGKGKNKPDQPKQGLSKPPGEEGAKRKPKYPCLICEEDHYTKDCPRWAEVSRLLKAAQGIPVVLKEPFPSQQTQMVADPSSSYPFGSQVFMAGTIPIHVSTRAKDYPSSAGKEPEVPSSAPPSSSGPLHIERPSTETTIRPPPKGVLRRSSYNPNARAAQHYSIMEDLAQALSAMSALKVIQSYPPPPEEVPAIGHQWHRPSALGFNHFRSRESCAATGSSDSSPYTSRHQF